jgi:hypothetical protein
MTCLVHDDEQEVQKKVLRITKNQEVRMIQDTGVVPSLNENDVKLYLEEVLEEIKAKRGI